MGGLLGFCSECCCLIALRGGTALLAGEKPTPFETSFTSAMIISSGDVFLLLLLEVAGPLVGAALALLWKNAAVEIAVLLVPGVD